MNTYCKAYPVAELRRYPGWTDKAEPVERDLADDDLVYVCDDFTVLTDPIGGKGVLFSEDTPQWRDFCTTVLSFGVPADLAFAYPE
jgi:hypothetical protein